MTDGPVCVVLCCRDRAALLARAVPRVVAQLRPGDELVVVDSASHDPEVGALAAAAGAKVLRCGEPGLARARNLGWRAASAPLVLFVDDDCLPLPGWLRAAAGAFADPGIGAVWGAVVADRASGVPLSVGGEGLAELDLAADLSQAGHGACMAFRREALEAIGGFDVLLGAGGLLRAGEDKDALLRVVRTGQRVVALPDMAVTHVVHRDDRAARQVMTGYGVGTGALVRKRALAGDDGHALLRGELWRHGLLPAMRWARERRWAAAGGALSRASGVLRGWWTTRRMTLIEGHLHR